MARLNPDNLSGRLPTDSPAISMANVGIDPTQIAAFSDMLNQAQTTAGTLATSYRYDTGSDRASPPDYRRSETSPTAPERNRSVEDREPADRPAPYQDQPIQAPERDRATDKESLSTPPDSSANTSVDASAAGETSVSETDQPAEEATTAETDADSENQQSSIDAETTGEVLPDEILALAEASDQVRSEQSSGASQSGETTPGASAEAAVTIAEEQSGSTGNQDRQQKTPSGDVEQTTTTLEQSTESMGVAKPAEQDSTASTSSELAINAVEESTQAKSHDTTSASIAGTESTQEDNGSRQAKQSKRRSVGSANDSPTVDKSESQNASATQTPKATVESLLGQIAAAQQSSTTSGPATTQGNSTTSPSQVDTLTAQKPVAATSTGTAGTERPETQNAQQSDRVRFVQRVTKAFSSAAAAQSGTVRLKLHPQELGSITIKISVQNGAMTAQVEAETATARSMLLENLPLLRERLAEQNIRIEQFDVDLMKQSPDGTPQQSSEDAARDRESRQDTSSRERSSETESTETLRATSGMPQTTEADRLDIVI